MSNDLPNWERPHYQPSTDHALVYWAIHGKFTNEVEISRSKYRTAGPPEGVTCRKVGRQENKPLPFTDDVFGKGITNQALFEQIKTAPECMVIQGEFADSTNLNYLRDCIGVVTFFLDHGGWAVCDPQQIELYDAGQWRSTVFEPGETNVQTQVKILLSNEPDGRWFHTRGLRKFARPDISVVGTPPDQRGGAIDLCNRLIRMQILGGQIAEGQEIRMASLPPGLICHHAGNLDDPDFNNVHVEIRWPKTVN